MENLQQLRGAIRAFVFSRVKDPALADDFTERNARNSGVSDPWVRRRSAVATELQRPLSPAP